MAVQSAADLIVLLLYAQGPTGKVNEEVKGITRMEKLMYLLLKEGGFEESLSGEVSFEPYDFGPYSAEIYNVIEGLEVMRIIRVREEKISSYKDILDGLYAEAEGQDVIVFEKVMKVYSLTEDRGLRIAEELLKRRVTEEELRRTQVIKAKYNALDLEDLLRYVYTKYPESAKKSKITEKILGFGRRPGLKPFEREEEM